MPATIEGGTPAQREVLVERLQGLRETSIELILLEAWVDYFAEHPSLGLVAAQEEIDVLRPYGHAWAARLFVDEPHLVLPSRLSRISASSRALVEISALGDTSRYTTPPAWCS